MVGSVEVWGIKSYGRGPSPGMNSFPEFPSQSSRSWGEIYKLENILGTVLGRSGVGDKVAQRKEIVGEAGCG